MAKGASITNANRSRVIPGSMARLFKLGRPLKRNMAPTVESPANNTVSSNMIGTKAGQELNGFPPTIKGQSTAEVQYSKRNAKQNPVIPAANVTNGNDECLRPCAA